MGQMDHFDVPKSYGFWWDGIWGTVNQMDSTAILKETV